MKTTNPQISGISSQHDPVGTPARTALGRRRIALLVALLVAVCGAYAHAVSPSDAEAREAGYQWPVRPFDQPHPVRGNFGDPRTTFTAPPTISGLMAGGGTFAFHFGIDISAPDGTPVYPVASGVARVFGGHNVRVHHRDGFATEYWHIVPAISSGQLVVAYKTVLGRVQDGFEHVHFSECRDGRFVNPLARGHLEPYEDTTRPTVGDISFRDASGKELLPEYVHGRVQLLAEVSDSPARKVPGRWAHLPVAPAYISWHLQKVGGRRVTPEQVAFDVRVTEPRNDHFWRYYARGSRQNMCSFNGQRAWRLPGVYLYTMTRGTFDTERLPNGIYQLVVTARDTHGNRSSTAQTMIVRNGH